MQEKRKQQIAAYYDYWFEVNALYEKWAKQHCLTAHALFALYTIREYPEACTQRRICDMLQLPKQTIGAILDTFEKKGYLEKEVMESDRRNKRIVLTEKGKAYAEGILSDLYRFEMAALDGMKEEEIRGLLAGGQRLREEMVRVLKEE